jgi:ferredoxin
LSRSTKVYTFIQKIWPLKKIALKISKKPLIGRFIYPFYSRNIHQATMIPIHEKLQTGKNSFIPAEILTPIIQNASYRFILSGCLCRESENCQNYPQDFGCLYLGEGAAEINPKMGRLASVEEALKHVEKAAEIGLPPMVVHTVFDTYLLGINYHRMLAICFCCDCCCAVRQGLDFGPSSFWKIIERMPGITLEISDECIQCGECIEICPVKAISPGDNHPAISEECKGCGRCLNVCPVEAIHVESKNNLDIQQRLIERVKSYSDIYSDGRK